MASAPVVPVTPARRITWWASLAWRPKAPWCASVRKWSTLHFPAAPR